MKNNHVSVLPGAAFQSLSLIQNHVLPLDPLEVLHILDDQLVARNHHVERCILSVKRFLRKKSQQKGLQTKKTTS